MKILVSALLLTLCAFAVPALADSPEESCPTALETSLSGLTETPIFSVEGFPQPYPYCWDVHLTYCSPVGSTKRCQDGTWSDYYCVCWYDSYRRTNYWDCPEVR